LVFLALPERKSTDTHTHSLTGEMIWISDRHYNESSGKATVQKFLSTHYTHTPPTAA
jgi:hypothetical protein